jgi:type I restriction enzyme S subunit
MSGSRVLRGDVLLNITGASIGRVCVVPDAICPANVNQHVCIIRCGDSLHPEYVAALLSIPKFQAFIWESQAGGTRQALTKQMIEDFEIPWVPIEKQRQIAARLKAQLAEVDKARQAAEAQLKDAQALYASILKETFIDGTSKTWPKIELGEVGDVVAGFTLGRKTNGKETRSIHYLRVANVKDGHLDLSDVSSIEATEAEIDRLLLQPGDILLTEGGDPDKLGRGTFWNGELKECIHQNHIFRVRFPADSYLPEFIAAQISSTYGKDYFFAHAKKTTGIATINQKVLKGFLMLSPTIEIQKSVMNGLNRRLDEAGRIIQSSIKQLTDITLLPRKILAQAFEI